MKNEITAKTILNLLLQKHSKDLCISECKTGSTWFTKRLFIIDLWVMKKSWTKPYTYCYEIKINRQDFLNDTKWREYLKYCSDFYFVTLPGIIESNELPNEAGLIVTSVNGKRLFTKKKAISRLDIEIPEDLFRYILMWRSMQKKENEIISPKIYWKEWLNKKKINYKFGYNVSRNIREIIKKEIDEVRYENDILKKENNNLTKLKKTILKMGINEDEIQWSYSFLKSLFEKKLEEISRGRTGDFKKYIEKIIMDLQETISIINN